MAQPGRQQRSGVFPEAALHRPDVAAGQTVPRLLQQRHGSVQQGAFLLCLPSLPDKPRHLVIPIGDVFHNPPQAVPLLPEVPQAAVRFIKGLLHHLFLRLKRLQFRQLLLRSLRLHGKLRVFRPESPQALLCLRKVFPRQIAAVQIRLCPVKQGRRVFSGQLIALQKIPHRRVCRLFAGLCLHAGPLQIRLSAGSQPIRLPAGTQLPQTLAAALLRQQGMVSLQHRAKPACQLLCPLPPLQFLQGRSVRRQVPHTLPQILRQRPRCITMQKCKHRFPVGLRLFGKDAALALHLPQLLLQRLIFPAGSAQLLHGGAAICTA